MDINEIKDIFGDISLIDADEELNLYKFLRQNDKSIIEIQDKKSNFEIKVITNKNIAFDNESKTDKTDIYANVMMAIEKYFDITFLEDFTTDIDKIKVINNVFLATHKEDNLLIKAKYNLGQKFIETTLINYQTIDK